MKHLIILLMTVQMSPLVVKSAITNSKKADKEFALLVKHFKWMDRDTYSIIKERSLHYGLDIIYVSSVIQYESGSYCGNNLEWMKRVRSHAGAIGLMQVMPFHAKNPKMLEDVKFNIHKGTWYLSLCLKKSKGSLIHTARRYNAGVNNKAWKYKNWPYVNRIIKKYKQVKNVI